LQCFKKFSFLIAGEVGSRSNNILDPVVGGNSWDFLRNFQDSRYSSPTAAARKKPRTGATEKKLFVLRANDRAGCPREDHKL